MKLENDEKEEMWIGYMDFMRDQWPNIEDIQQVEQRYNAFNSLAPPYKSAFTDWLKIKKTGAQDPGPYKKQKINH